MQSLGVFTHCKSHVTFTNTQELFYENADFYLLIGILCGLAMYNQVLVDLPFPLLLYKKLLGRYVSVFTMHILKAVAVGL